jgi:peptide/nickel transport system permease protein
MTESAIATPESLEPDGFDSATTDLDRGEVVRRRRRAGKLGSYVVTVFFLVTVNFFLPRAMPGDPIQAMVEAASAGTSATGTSATTLRDEQTTVQARRYYGLDRPLLAQYGRYLGGLVRGDLGVSIRYNAPVATLLSERLGWSLLLGATAVALGAGVGIVAGTASAWRRAGSWTGACSGCSWPCATSRPSSWPPWPFSSLG